MQTFSLTTNFFTRGKIKKLRVLHRIVYGTLKKLENGLENRGRTFRASNSAWELLIKHR